jgi:hypothetical protein
MQTTHTTKTNDLVVSDICGAFKASYNGKCNTALFVHDFSFYMTQFLLQTLDEILHATQTFFKMAKNWHKHPIKMFRIDNTKEYTLSAMEMILQRDGTHHEMSMIVKVE